MQPVDSGAYEAVDISAPPAERPKEKKRWFGRKKDVDANAVERGELTPENNQSTTGLVDSEIKKKTDKTKSEPDLRRYEKRKHGRRQPVQRSASRQSLQKAKHERKKQKPKHETDDPDLLILPPLPRPEKHYKLVIAAMICFLPTGLAALFFQCVSDDAVLSDDLIEAERKSKTAFQFSIASIIFGILAIIIFALLFASGAWRQGRGF